MFSKPPGMGKGAIGNSRVGDGLPALDPMHSSVVSRLKKHGKDKRATVEGETDTGSVPELKRGGKIKRGGIAKLHAGEQVLTAKETKRYKARGKKR